MRNKILYFTSIAMLLLVGACSEDAIFEDSSNNLSSGGKNTITLTADMPVEPTPRVALEQDELTLDVSLKWEAGDQIQLAFVQGATKIKNVVTVKNITEDGKSAQFDIAIPEEINDGEFDLYGVYGGGGLSDEDPTLVKLPTNPGDAGSLASVQEKKHVMLYFESKNTQTTNPQVSVNFQHLGSLFSITVKNTCATPLTELSKAQLIEAGVNSQWAFNSKTGLVNYNLLTGKFTQPDWLKNTYHLSFKATSDNLPSGETLTFWGWNPPLPEKNWPELKLQLNANRTLTTFNTKEAKAAPTATGRSYYFYAVWDGSNLAFTDDQFTAVAGPVVYNVESAGTLGTLITDKNITAMKLTGGPIIKADFDVMKSQMPNLKYIDLKDVTCQNNTIPWGAFGGWPGNVVISTIILPESVTKIDGAAFANCKGITGTMDMPTALKEVATQAFFATNNLSGTLHFPSTLETIGVRAFHALYDVDVFRFDRAEPIEYVYSTGGDKPLGIFPEDANPKNIIIEVPTDAAVAAYEADEDWGKHTIRKTQP